MNNHIFIQYLLDARIPERKKHIPCLMEETCEHQHQSALACMLFGYTTESAVRQLKRFVPGEWEGDVGVSFRQFKLIWWLRKMKMHQTGWKQGHVKEEVRYLRNCAQLMCTSGDVARSSLSTADLAVQRAQGSGCLLVMGRKEGRKWHRQIFVLES